MYVIYHDNVSNLMERTAVYKVSWLTFLSWIRWNWKKCKIMKLKWTMNKCTRYILLLAIMTGTVYVEWLAGKLTSSTKLLCDLRNLNPPRPPNSWVGPGVAELFPLRGSRLSPTHLLSLSVPHSVQAHVSSNPAPVNKHLQPAQTLYTYCCKILFKPPCLWTSLLYYRRRLYTWFIKNIAIVS